MNDDIRTMRRVRGQERSSGHRIPAGLILRGPTPAAAPQPPGCPPPRRSGLDGLPEREPWCVADTQRKMPDVSSKKGCRCNFPSHQIGKIRRSGDAKRWWDVKE